MKKIISALFILVIATSLVSCGNNSEPSNRETNKPTENTNINNAPTLKEVPAGFVKGFTEAEFSKYNSLASENGLGDTPIWIEGSLGDVSELKTEDYNYYIATVTDDKENKWLAILDVEGFGKKDTYSDICNHILRIKGVYQGYSQVYEMPALNAIGFFDRETGNIIQSIAFSAAYEGEFDSDQPTNQSQNDQSTQTAIRPEIKEAIDSYEAFINTYCEFLESFDSSNLSMLAKYAELMSQYTETQKQFETLGNADLNDAELAYYTEVSLRCSSKLLEASANISSDMSNIVGSFTG